MLTRPPPPMEGGYSPMNRRSLQGLLSDCNGKSIGAAATATAGSERVRKRSEPWRVQHQRDAGARAQRTYRDSALSRVGMGQGNTGQRTHNNHQ
jgi:hypothetical protein